MGLLQPTAGSVTNTTQGIEKCRPRQTSERTGREAQVMGRRTWDADHPEWTARLAKGMK